MTVRSSSSASVAVMMLAVLLRSCWWRAVECCRARHWVTDASKDRTGLQFSINVLGNAHALDRLEAYTLPWLPHVDRNTTEVNIGLQAGTERANHRQRLQADNVLYLDGRNAGDRFINLVNMVAQLSSCSVDWFMFVPYSRTFHMLQDDDTFVFPKSLPDLLMDLDPNEEVYIGNGSEELVQQFIHGWFAQTAHNEDSMHHDQGGGGIIVSRALLTSLIPYWHHVACMGPSVHGDERLRDCISAMGVKLKSLPHLHQMDMRGDVSGFLEGYASNNRPLVSMHHLPLDVSLMPNTPNDAAAAAMLRAHVAFPDSFMQRFVLQLPDDNATVVLTLGYSIQILPALMGSKDLEPTESTMAPWRLPFWDNGRFDGYHFPTRPRVVGKRSYYFQDVFSKPRAMQVYADARRNTVLVLCSKCAEGQPLCARSTATTASGLLLKLDSVYCSQGAAAEEHGAGFAAQQPSDQQDEGRSNVTSVKGATSSWWAGRRKPYAVEVQQQGHVLQ